MEKQTNVKRRNFLKGASAGIGLSIASTSGFANASEKNEREKLPREVWIASLTLQGLEARSMDEMVRKVIGRMEQTLPCHPDIICLPEAFPYKGVPDAPPDSEIAETIPGPIVERFAIFAKNHHCNVICPMSAKENGLVYNSAVVIDRKGKVLGAFHKIHPTVGEIESGVTPGPIDPPVFQTDFGTIGIQICFDINWHDGWRRLRKKGAEIIFWPSAFPGGRMLNGLAWMTKCCIVSSTWPDPCRIIDITGDEIASSGRFEHWICAPVNLEKAFIHIWPYTQNLDDLRAKYGQKVRITKMHLEDWAIVESVSADVKLVEVLKEFEIPIHEEHIQRAEQAQDKLRL
ncbi:MAG: carbon-nitrogen hydrolase family protein [Candidatus Omnitrophota bacterium]|jgi:hypothetical protein|nr:MAG: carbon-nitrogen hydrolase family protein [Candidatus Omnitrophota bacterium]